MTDNDAAEARELARAILARDASPHSIEALADTLSQLRMLGRAPLASVATELTVAAAHAAPTARGDALLLLGRVAYVLAYG